MTTNQGRADWRESGACAQADPDLFFPISSAGRSLGQIAKAKAICAGCPVQRRCLDFALEHDVMYGIWGGSTPLDRQARQRERRRERLRSRVPSGREPQAYPQPPGDANSRTAC